MKRKMKYKLNKAVLLMSAALLFAGCAAPSGQEQNSKAVISIMESPLPSGPASSGREQNGKDEDPAMSAESEAVLTNDEAPVHGLHTLENFLKTALLPVGRTMYVWGGGWNEEDTGAGEEARTLGVSEGWEAFAKAQTADYDYHDTRYQIHDGLDCSGFVGWTVYNVMENESGHEGYVLKSTDTAKTYASYGWGDFLKAEKVQGWLPGDIASMKGHVWICLGTCSDGSVLLVHSSPPGVRICGTTLVSGAKGGSEAIALAESFMSTHCPEWYSRFPDCSVDLNYLTSSAQMRWNEETFEDAGEIRALTPSELLARIAP